MPTPKTHFTGLSDCADNALFRLMMAAIVSIHAWRELPEPDRRTLRTWARRTQAAQCTPDEYLAASVVLTLANEPFVAGGLSCGRRRRPRASTTPQ